MHNQVSIMGNLTRDPELRYAGETPICKFGIALNNRYRSRDGELQEQAHFFDCVAFGKTAESINEHFHKGKQILLSGALSYSSWEDRETGQKRSKVEIKVFGFNFTGHKGDDEGGGGRRESRDDGRWERDSRSRGSSSRGGGSRGGQSSGGDGYRQDRDDRSDGRDPPRGGGSDYDFDEIPF